MSVAFPKDGQGSSGLDILSAAIDESGLGMDLNVKPFSGFGQGVVARGTNGQVSTPGLTNLQKIQQSLLKNQQRTSVLGNLLGRGHSPYFVEEKPQVNNVLNTPNVPTSAHVAKLWNNDDHIKKMTGSSVNNIYGDFGAAVKSESTEADEDEEEELGHADTYAVYMPSKLKIGEQHPDAVVETSSLSSVQPPDVWYRLAIPEVIIDYNYLSALQLEAIVYASQQHDKFLPDGTRAGFLIGDGAGVGKGRTIAGIIYENYLLGRKRSIWVSVSNDLKYDAERDLKDIGAGKLDVNPLNKFKYAKISSKVNGSVKKGVIFATYSSLIGESQSSGKYKTRLKQILNWCGENFEGVIVFDECHKAKNLCPSGSAKATKTGLTVLELQNRLPKARIVYASATGASEPRNMAYMTRLGLWGPGSTFREFTDFLSAVEKRGVGAMEIVAMDMKLRGTYIARQLSFAGVSFKIEEIPLCADFISVYDESVDLWVDARAKFQKAVDLIDGEPRMRKTMWGQFWSAHQRFFKYMCIASKVKHVVKLTREAVKNNKCVVIGLQSTGEARTMEQLEEAGGELNDFVSTAKGVLQSLIEKHFPAPDRRRINRLLGRETLIDTLFEESPVPSPSTSSGIKRKPVRQARQGTKRYKEDKGSDDSNSANDVSSDFHVSASDSSSEGSDLSSPEASDSDAEESDFNPFGLYCGSDSDDSTPWVNRKSKKKVKTKLKKKHKKKEKLPRPTTTVNFVEKVKMNGTSSQPPGDSIEMACSMKDELMARLERLGERLPPNTLDQLIDDLGGTDNVAEMTGRKGRVVSNSDGGIQYESRSEVDVPLETLNLTEKQRFMDGDKQIAIISEAASSGISLQSDRRAKNQLRRVHITLELPWSADRAVQQFGRTHRSNQMNAPEYLFLISDLAGERRFASIVAKRLESLGALTHGDRRATESRDLSQFNIDNKYGRAALEAVMKSVVKMEAPLVPPPKDYKGDFFSDIQQALVGVGLVAQDEHNCLFNLDKDYNNMSKFLNRILGMRVELQNRLFKYFSDTLAAIVTQAKRAGRYDLGILDLGAATDQVKQLKCDNFIIKHATGTAKLELHTVSVERGMTWAEAQDIWTELVGHDEGFYISLEARNGKYTSILAVSNATVSRKKEKKERGEKMYSIYRPNTGLQLRQESLEEIRRKYKKVIPDLAEPHWQEQYDSASVTCTHAYWRGSCRKIILGLPCDVGVRRKLYHILSGSVLNVWAKVESVMANMPGSNTAKMQVIRLRTDKDLRIVGSVIPLNCYAQLVNVLTQDATKTYTETF